jgi:uncharacterized SAM-binding protein YcdF (DUF218 family)
MVVVVLGNRLQSDGIHEHLRGRVDLGIRLLGEDEDGALVLTGGRSNPDVDRTESEVMAAYAVDRGVDPDAVLEEPMAKDTVGNGYFCRRLIEERLDASTVRIATSCYHVARAVFVFEHCFGDGYEVTAPSCYDADVEPASLSEGRSMSLNRRFFDPIEPGDVDAIRARLLDRHPLYSAADFEGVTT